MPVKIDVNESMIASKVQIAWEKSLFALSSQILGDCNQYVKFDRGALESSSYASSRLSKGVLIWNTPYAKRQYWEIKTSLTPGRTWKWCETAKKKHRADWQKLAERLLRSNL